MSDIARPYRSNSDSTITDPWNTTPKKQLANPNNQVNNNDNNDNNNDTTTTEVWELPTQERVEINQREELAGSFLLKHLIWTIHVIKTDSVIERRFSDFDWLLICLTKRYPFKLLPSLPPKQISLGGKLLATDDLFLERRRKGLTRFLNYCINHPTLRNDHLVRTFLSEQSDLSIWKKTASYSLEEEFRILTTLEEDSIPSNFEENLKSLTIKIHALVEHWTEISKTYDRLAHRLGNQGRDWEKLKYSFENVILVERDRIDNGSDENNLLERRILTIAEYSGRAGELNIAASIRQVETTVEELKRHRELFINFRELIGRQIRLSSDGVDKIRKRSSSTLLKLDQLRQSPSKNYEVEAEALANSVEADQKLIERLIRRRSFIRYSVYKEYLFLFQSINLLSSGLKDFATEELSAAERIRSNWSQLNESL